MQAEARGALIRMQTLRYERETHEAMRIARDLASRIGSDPYIQARFYLNFAALLERQDDAEANREALTLLLQLKDDFGLSSEAAPLDLTRQLGILSDVAVALNRHGRHRDAIQIQERLLDRAAGAQNDSRIQIQLANLATSHIELGYESACSHHREQADRSYTHALHYADEALRRGPTHLSDAGSQAQVTSVLARRSLRHRARFELTILAERSDTAEAIEHLRALEAEAEGLIRETDGHLGSTRPLLARFGRLGAVIIERLRLCTPPNQADLVPEATVALSFLLPLYDSHVLDSDWPVATGIRYAAACVMVGDRTAARKALTEILRHAEVSRGVGYGACVRIRERLEELGATDRGEAVGFEDRWPPGSARCCGTGDGTTQ